MALSAAASLVSLELSNALSTDFVDGMMVMAAVNFSDKCC